MAHDRPNSPPPPPRGPHGGPGAGPRGGFGKPKDLKGTTIRMFRYIAVHPLLLVLVLTPRRRFDGQNIWTYFLWYGLGRVWIEGLRTDSLYLFDWTLFGEPIRVSQGLSAVMIVISVVALAWNLHLCRKSPAVLYVNRIKEQPAALCADEKEEMAADEQTLSDENKRDDGEESGL